jgi:ParB/RepB/Spo0J family partition protein
MSTAAAREVLDHEVIGAVLRVPRSRVRRYAKQPRGHFDPQKLQALATSIREVGQKRPATVRRVTDDPEHDFEVIDGERRWLACGIAGIELFKVIVENPKDEEEQFESSAVSNFGAAEHTPLETARAMQRIRESKKYAHLSATEKVEKVAAVFGCTPVWVYQNLSLLRLHPGVQKMLEADTPEDDRISVAAAIAISSLPAAEQFRVAQEIQSQKLKGNKAKQHIRDAGERLGIKTSMAKRSDTPVESYRRLRTFLGRLDEGQLFVQMIPEAIASMFRHRDPQDRVEALDQIAGAIRGLMRLQAAITKTLPLSR